MTGHRVVPAPSTAGRPPLPPRSSGSEIPGWVLVVAVLVMLAMAAVAAWILLGSKPAPARTYPDAWDSRVAPYAKIAERQRGLLFQHPVEVRFLAPAEFEKDLGVDEDELAADDRKELEQVSGLLRAFGLVKGDLDLLSALDDFSTGGTLAYYSFKDERITVRGNRLTPAVRSTLVHELTHVLQDQHFDVGARTKKLEASKKDSSSGESAVLDGLIEGDAERVETLYRASLTPKQRKALDASAAGENAEASTRIKKVPKIIVTMLTSSYTLGQSLVQTAAADGENAAVDALFRKPPRTESALLDPLGALDGGAEAVEVARPKVADGEKKFDSGVYGALGWYFMLAERMPFTDALTAADGWGGDAYVGFERGGESCARMSYVGRTSADTARMLRALQRWVAAAPGSPASVRREGDHVRFESCDPGRTARVGKDASPQAVGLVANRAYLAVGLLRSGTPRKAAHCLSDRLVRVFPASVLAAPTASPAVVARIKSLAAGCR